jgi:uncharacterized protein YndB with AHSA1/START domain
MTMDKPVVEVETTVAADPKNIWKAMTAKKTAMFPGTDVDTDWKVGHPITFTGEWKGKKFKDKGQIETFDPPKELAFTHWSEMSGEADRPENYHVVRFTLQPDGKKTRVKLSQINKGKEEVGAKAQAEFKKNWQMMLDGLKKSIETA